MSAVTAILKPHVKDLGGFEVRRLLPGFPHKMVGPFIFFDHMGPARFAPGQGMDVRPHPHIGLATVTYLFEGALCTATASARCSGSSRETSTG